MFFLDSVLLWRRDILEIVVGMITTKGVYLIYVDGIDNKQFS